MKCVLCTHTWSSGHTHTPGAVDTHTHTPGAVDTVHSGNAPARPPHVTFWLHHGLGLHDYCWYWGAAVHWGKHGFQHVLWHSEPEDDVLPSETVFQHNHPKHTAKMTTALLLKVKVMEWPSMSPDLNPIEHMWSILRQKLEKHYVSNIQ